MDRKKDKKPVLLILILIILVAAAGGIYYVIERNMPSKKEADLNAYFGITSENEVAITAGTQISDTKGRVIDKKIYLDYDSVHKLINPSFYYEASDALLIVTTPTVKQSLPIVNGSSEKKEAVIDGDVLYIDLDYVKQWSDVEAVVSDRQQFQSVMVETAWSYPAAKVGEDGVLRERASIKGDILCRFAEGDVVRILDEQAEEDWRKVLSQDGLIGYIKKDALGETFETEDNHVSAIGEYVSASDGKPVNMAFHQTTSQAANNALASVLSDVHGINVVAPTWFFLNDKNGEMTSLESSSYVQTAHEMGLKVWAVMNDFDGSVASGEATAAALSSDESRTRIIQTVVNGVVTSGADGINVDFEKVTQSSAEAFLEMIRELSVECRNRGLVLSIDNYVPTFTKFMGRKEQARVADYVVTMCYDEHTSSSEQAGSVASISFMKNGLKETMDGGVPKEKLIAAIPFYTRLWKTSGDGKVSCTAYGMSDAKEAVANLGMDIAWDETSGQNYGKKEVSGETYEIWLEDEDSLSLKMQVIRDMDIAGVAEWKLGQERSDIWDIISMEK